MKRTLLISFIITGVCFGQIHEFAEEFYKNGIPKVTNTYKESREKLELVKQVSWYDNGQKKKEETYKVGGKNGKWTEWHWNGQKRSETTYKDGKLNGLWKEWFDNGQQRTIGTFKVSLRIGKWTEWFDNGQKSKELTYIDDKLDGLQTIWNENGNEQSVSLNDGKFKGDIDIYTFKSVFIIDGRFRCFDGSKSVKASWVNDKECDCSDCSDEPLMKR